MKKTYSILILVIISFLLCSCTGVQSETIPAWVGSFCFDKDHFFNQFAEKEGIDISSMTEEELQDFKEDMDIADIDDFVVDWEFKVDYTFTLCGGDNEDDLEKYEGIIYETKDRILALEAYDEDDLLKIQFNEDYTFFDMLNFDMDGVTLRCKRQ